MISLTFDTDHMDGSRMAEFLSTTEIHGSATFFCTQQYTEIDESIHEVGPHTFLGAGDDWGQRLREARSTFPEAVGWRSHSCVFSHIVAEQLAGLGYQYASTHDELGRVDPAPHAHAWGIWQVPIYYMDNLDFSAGNFWNVDHTPFSQALIAQALSGSGLYVFAFHPVHLMLNCPSAEFYFSRRERFIVGEPTAAIEFSGYGARSFFEDLTAAMKTAGVASVQVRKALDRYVGLVQPSFAPPDDLGRAAIVRS